MEYEILEAMFEGENPKSVFEIGVGGGGLLRDVSESYGGLKIGGIDISKVRMEGLKGLEGEFLLHDLNDPWPVPDNSYDIVFSVGVLMYIFDPVPVVKEMLRVCKDKIILAEYNSTEIDEHGGLMKYSMSYGIQTAIGRNYLRVFDNVGVFKDKKTITMRDLQKYHGKTIIKCQKFQ